ncbi:protein CWC16 [Clathrus columnatus]|uniref:Splicing factor YJU2 n=1 Tax=Clathrus columnatus TaxID=1419009 RepID=A0AAV5AG96_9AGAM|nr:protein CWC16 [Clathrus columnatus]
MSERKVLNKYYPPDFDPSKIPRRRGPKNSQQVVRLMAPFSMRCNTCGDYIYKGKKFNARKETVEGEDYYGIKIFSTLCSSEITFKTDPKNTDYSAEHGASRNFEPWRDEKAEEEDRLARLEEEENNPMKALENRQIDSKREMDILDALQDIRDRNSRNERVGQNKAAELVGKLGLQELEDEETRQRRLEEEEDERLVREVFSKVPSTPTAEQPGNVDDESSSNPLQAVTIKRKAAVLDAELDESLPRSSAPAPKPILKRKKEVANSLGIKVVKKKVAV